MSWEPLHYILRSLAAVPVGERLLLAGVLPPQFLDDIGKLGYSYDCLTLSGAGESRIEETQSSYQWAVVILEKSGVSETATLLGAIRSAIRPGGWAIVCVCAVPDPDEWFAEDSVAAGGFETAGYVLAERVASFRGGCHLIVRRPDSTATA